MRKAGDVVEPVEVKMQVREAWEVAQEAEITGRAAINAELDIRTLVQELARPAQIIA